MFVSSIVVHACFSIGKPFSWSNIGVYEAKANRSRRSEGGSKLLVACSNSEGGRSLEVQDRVEKIRERNIFHVVDSRAPRGREE